MAAGEDCSRDEDEAEQGRDAPLLGVPAAQADEGGVVYMDWLYRPALGRRDLGGWKCAACMSGVKILGCMASSGITFNLVIYLVQVCGQTSAAAANIVTTVLGTILICSLLGAFLSDAYLGRLWSTLIFQSLSALGSALISAALVVISRGGATHAAMSFLLFSLYFKAFSSGSRLPNCSALGADQLSFIEEKEKYFRLLSVSVSVGQLLAVTLVTYFDNMGLWVCGSLLCTAASIIEAAVVGGAAKWFRQYKGTGNPFLRNLQVLVAACRKCFLSAPEDASLLYEYQGNLTATSEYPIYQHTATLSFLDKAAVLGSPETYHRWHLCTVSQVEELKSIVRVIPVGIALVLVATATAQTSTLFEVQALNMNSRVATWLVIPPASLNVFFFGSGIIMGLVTTVSRARLPGWVFGQRRAKKLTSLQMQGVGLMFNMVAMVIAGLVESYRRHVAQRGALLSVLWLVPQTILVGAGGNLASSGGNNFFYDQVPDSMRTVGTSFYYIFQGAGNYISSILVALVTAITTQGGRSGWIADNLNEGHLDYFYWLLACCLAVTLGIYIIYTCSYNYARPTHIDDGEKM